MEGYHDVLVAVVGACVQAAHVVAEEPVGG